MTLSTFEQVRQKALETPAMTVAVAGAEDPEVLRSLQQARDAGLINGALLVGDCAAIEDQLAALDMDPRHLTLVPAAPGADSARAAVAAINQGRAQVLVKGALPSAAYFQAILNREEGLRAGELLSNLTLFELPSYSKLLAITDNALTLQPNLRQKAAIIANTRPLFRALGITPARVAVVAAVEKETLAMPATTDGVWLQRMNGKGQLAGFIVEGPFGYDACICREAAARKGITDSRVAGEPDLLLMPNLEAANILGKAYKYHGQADSGGLVLGARVPVVLNSRSDSARRRFNSLLLAKLMVGQAPDN